MDNNLEDGLSDLRLRGVFALVGVSWLATITIIACAFSTGSMVAPLQALGLTIIPTMLAWQRRHDVAARVALGVALPLYPAILLAQWHMSSWQIDLHLLFFAVLAVVAVMADWRPVVAAAGVTAVHHLLLNFVAPEYVFGAGGDLARVVLHAVIVVIETAVLVLLAKQVEHLVMGQAQARAAQAAVEAVAQAERARHEAEQRTVIDALRTRLLALSAGQVGTRLDVPFPAAYEELRRAMNDACEQLLVLIEEVNGASQFITTGVNEIRAASNDLAHRTEEQASALEQNSSITRRLSDQITQNAVQAAQVDGAIRDAQTDAREGGEVVEQAMVAMTEIEKSSAEIGQIISMIDGIAFQTNLLALNAGVEAARAGEAGKGFAVVASEVRALAQRSAEAASTIKQLVTGSGHQVTRGVELVARTGKSLEALVSRFADIGDAVGEIARSAAAQAGDLRQVTTAFGQIDHATQQNAAMVEQSNAAAQGLAREVERLVDSVSRFDTAAGTQGVAVGGRLRAV